MPRTVIESFNFSRLNTKGTSERIYKIDLIANHDGTYSIESTYGIRDGKLTRKCRVDRKIYITCQVKLVHMTRDIANKGYTLNNTLPNSLSHRCVVDQWRLSKFNSGVGDREFYELYIINENTRDGKYVLTGEFSVEVSSGCGSIPNEHITDGRPNHYPSCKGCVAAWISQLESEGHAIVKHIEHRQEESVKTQSNEQHGKCLRAIFDASSFAKLNQLQNQYYTDSQTVTQ